MTARSPVAILTSSPSSPGVDWTRELSASISPPSAAEDQHRNGIPSSPDLLSPRLLFKQGLKGGSNAMEIPDGAQTGFESAKGVYHALEKRCHNDTRDAALAHGLGCEGEREAGKHNYGKLLRPWGMAAAGFAENDAAEEEVANVKSPAEGVGDELDVYENYNSAVEPKMVVTPMFRNSREPYKSIHAQNRRTPATKSAKLVADEPKRLVVGKSNAQSIVKKLSSTQVLDSDSPEPELQRAERPAKKLSATQVLDSDEIEQDDLSEDDSTTIPGRNTARKPIDCALNDWKADVSKRQEARKKRAEEAALKLAKKAAQQTKKAQQLAHVDSNYCDEKSGYHVFNARKAPLTIEETTFEDTTGLRVGGTHVQEDHSVDSWKGSASRRENDRTTIEESVTKDSPICQSLDCDIADTRETTARDLASDLANFDYFNNIFTQPPPRTVTGESTTERRKLGPSEAHVAQQPSEDPSPNKPDKEKKPKAPPKKALTITALATAAYKQTEPHNSSTVSAFFPPVKPLAHQPPSASKKDAGAAAPVKAPRKSRKPRKPKTVAFDQDGKRFTPIASPKKPSKSAGKKANRKKNCQPLFTPEAARRQISDQDFVFGTSSQLAVEDSPSLLRQTLHVLKESEPSPYFTHAHSMHEPELFERTTKKGSDLMIAPSKTTTPGMDVSTIKASGTSHGTRLNCRQVVTALWCAGARDLEHGLLATKDVVVEALKDDCVGVPSIPTLEDVRNNEIVGDPLDEACRTADEEGLCDGDRVVDTLDYVGEAVDARSLDKRPEPLTNNSAAIDLIRSSPPITTYEKDQQKIDHTMDDTRCPDSNLSSRNARPPIDLGRDEDGSQISTSDSSAPVLPSQSFNDDEISSHAAQSQPLPLPSHRFAVKRLTGCAPAAVSPTRPALRPLDANISLATATSKSKPSSTQARGLSASSCTLAMSNVSPVKRSRGRPRNTEKPASITVTTPVKRRPGRPRKDKLPLKRSTNADLSSENKVRVGTCASAVVQHSSDSFLDIDEVSDRENEQVVSPPRKSHSRLRSPQVSPVQVKQLSGEGTAPTPPIRKRPASTSDFRDIDEISDSDTPNTPSPPRRRASPYLSSAPPSLPLSIPEHYQPSVFPQDTDLKNPALLPPSYLQTYVFPSITHAIKSTPPSAGHDEDMTWHEKILIYDPIVVEDLTTWLNEAHGLHIQCLRRKKKEKKRKVKRKKVDKIEDEEGPGKQDQGRDEIETETIKEALLPWMVQKWCEAHSVCCFYRTGIGFSWGPRGREQPKRYVPA